MFPGGEFVDILLSGKRNTVALCRPQVSHHRIPINSRFHPQVYATVLGSIEHVIAFILRVGHAEVPANVLRPRMHL